MPVYESLLIMCELTRAVQFAAYGKTLGRCPKPWQGPRRPRVRKANSATCAFAQVSAPRLELRSTPRKLGDFAVSECRLRCKRMSASRKRTSAARELTFQFYAGSATFHGYATWVQRHAGKGPRRPTCAFAQVSGPRNFSHLAAREQAFKSHAGTTRRGSSVTLAVRCGNGYRLSARRA